MTITTLDDILEEIERVMDNYDFLSGVVTPFDVYRTLCSSLDLKRNTTVNSETFQLLDVYEYLDVAFDELRGRLEHLETDDPVRFKRIILASVHGTISPLA